MGTWQVGGKWGSDFDHGLADRILNAAVDQGVNFIDTADVYSKGESEQAVGNLVKRCPDKIYVATKCGRFIDPHTNENYTTEALRGYVEASLRNMKIECIDLIQLHCPPPEVYYRPEIFELFDKLIEEGKIRNLGVSVEKVEEALKAIEYPNVSTVQIIFNVFRQRPSELFFQETKRRNIGVIVRVPLASGLLSGKYSAATEFGKDDHRSYNRNGEAFDKGETFSGIDYELGLEAVDRLKSKFPDVPLAQLALNWILQFKEVGCVIPGASRVEQVVSNSNASGMPSLNEGELSAINTIYDQLIKPQAHHQW